MSKYKLEKESKFLRRMAIREFNFQYHKNIDPDLCNIKSIRGGYGCKYGYEIVSLREGDNLRLRMYFNLGDNDQLLPYRLETDNTFAQGSLADEVYVTIGTVNQYYVESGEYKFRTMTTSAEDSTKTMTFMNGEVFETMDEGILEYVGN